ncbi:SDR family oxidoreductase [Roseateles saccharophilus]|uniref:Short-subunit dehydrogenase n=1 Tax=Roseateles saccharophilus TaxID=304 RepID=A0A4R3VCA4_ROSSA|nr:SDR family oxidoreductase [Roseateles saccharophilus]MDG0831789.1 SDR family oxidoreductase [Roseateles saccharophilus]TCV01189.1 short-subunit dehydrogenase [Roseateles saccharophilus]
MNVLIIGASRGLGLEFVRQYRAAGARVTATARDDAGLARLAELGAKPLKLDVADAASVSGLAWQIDGERFDVVVINAGVFGPRADALQVPAEADFDAVMRTNVLGPMRLLPQVADNLADGARLALISSRMGSIALRTSASGWLYRASKAAVNSVMKDASLVLAGKATVVSFHPGWVRTDMGGSGADIDAPTSIAGMRTVLASVKPADTGSFFNYDGQRLDW